VGGVGKFKVTRLQPVRRKVSAKSVQSQCKVSAVGEGLVSKFVE